MEIDYNNYPTILFTSFNEEDSSGGFPFNVQSEAAHNYLSQNEELHEMLSIIVAKNTFMKENCCTHYFLNSDLGVEIFFLKGDELLHSFSKKNIKSKCGTVLTGPSVQFVYLLLDKDETKLFKKKEGRYVAVALFFGNVFIGFEEGYIIDDHFRVNMHTNYYEREVKAGLYIANVLITLSYTEDRSLPLLKTKVTEKIYELV